MTWKINKATVTLTISPSSPPTYTYDGQEQGISYAITGIANSDTISLDVDFEGPFTTKGFNSGESLAQNTTYHFKEYNCLYRWSTVKSYTITINSLTDSNGNSQQVAIATILYLKQMVHLR